jgi:hypothetical protein
MTTDSTAGSLGPSGSRRPAATRGRWLHLLLMLAAMLVAWSQPQSASAWPCRWRAGPWGYGSGAACVRPFAFRPFCGFGYGYSSYSYRSFSYWTPGFATSYWYPNCYAPCATYAPCLTAYPWGGFGAGCGWYPFTPVVATPFFGGYPSAIAPVYGPAGVAPFLGFGATATPAAGGQGIVAARPAVAAIAETGRTGPNRLLRDGTAVRTSNSLARLRAGRLVAVGDRHMRAAVANPGKLVAALDAYRRAATIAPDLPDTFLRQAIVLTALDRRDDAGNAVDRAVAIDARLGTDEPAAVAAAERLPPDPVFGDRPAGEPTTLASRSGQLVSRIFADGQGNGGAADNWIADRWSRQWQDHLAALANR